MEKEQVSSGNIIDFNVLKRLMKFVSPYKGRFYALIFLTFTLGVLTPLRPMLIQRTIDNDVPVGDYEGMVWIIMILIGLLVVQSFVAWVSGAQPDLSDFQELKGNLVLLLLLVTLSWLVAAFGEEMVYRGYLMNRAAEWGGNGRRAWWLSAFLVSVLFGVAHASQGPSGMVVEGVAGFWLALAYLGTGRNLLVPIIIHGVQNTVDFGLIYLGLFPGM